MRSKVSYLAFCQDNVVLSADKKALICDFGCARICETSLGLAEFSSSKKGTNRFWAPEMVVSSENVSQTKATDIWALGMTIYVRSISVKLL